MACVYKTCKIIMLIDKQLTCIYRGACTDKILTLMLNYHIK